MTLKKHIIVLKWFNSRTYPKPMSSDRSKCYCIHWLGNINEFKNNLKKSFEEDWKTYTRKHKGFQNWVNWIALMVILFTFASCVRMLMFPCEPRLTSSMVTMLLLTNSVTGCRFNPAMLSKSWKLSVSLFQWSCRPAPWSSTPSSSLMGQSCRPTTSSTGGTGWAGEPPSSCWAGASCSACGRTFTRIRCTETWRRRRCCCWTSINTQRLTLHACAGAQSFPPYF